MNGVQVRSDQEIAEIEQRIRINSQRIEKRLPIATRRMHVTKSAAVASHRAAGKAVGPAQGYSDSDDDPIAHRHMLAELDRRLLRGVLLNSIRDLQDWSNKWRKWNTSGSERFTERFKAAWLADDWFRAPGRRGDEWGDEDADFDAAKITLKDVCEALELDIARVVERTYDLLDPCAIAVLHSVHLARLAVQRSWERERMQDRRRARNKAAVAFLEIVKGGVG